MLCVSFIALAPALLYRWVRCARLPHCIAEDTESGEQERSELSHWVQPPCAHQRRAWQAAGWTPALVPSLSVQDINISLWRPPEKVQFDKSVFMNQGEWELLGVLPQFREFSMESSDCYAEMKFYVSGHGCGRG